MLGGYFWVAKILELNRNIYMRLTERKSVIFRSQIYISHNTDGNRVIHFNFFLKKCTFIHDLRKIQLPDVNCSRIL